MLRRLGTIVLLAATFVAPAHAQGITLMPGVTFEKTVEFTPHGPVVVDVITAPRPGGLYQLTPALAHGTVTGGLEKLTQIEQDASAQATVAGIDGDYFSAKDGTPNGVVMLGGALAHPPVGTRSAAGIDDTGALHVDRVKFSATWQGAGQRRPLNGIDQTPASGQVVLFTPAYGAALPRIGGSVDAILASYPAAAPGTVLQAPVTSVGSGGGEVVPPGGAIVMATGAAAAHLQAEAPVGTTLALRLILQPAWSGVVNALGGGPVLVKNGKAVFHSLEDFTDDLVTSRGPRAGVGQLADGRIILVEVDGSQPGYSVGLSSFELGQTMQRLGAVTACATASGNAAGMAFDGTLLSRPSGKTGEIPIRDALLYEYIGVYAAVPPVDVVNGDAGRTGEQLSYKIVRPSTVTAQVVGPNGVAHVLETGVQHPAGSYVFPYGTFDAEGTWHWKVTATDDLGRVSSVDRTFRYDTTLRGLAAPKTAHGSAAIRFTLSRAASVKVSIETPAGVVVDELPAQSLAAGAQSVTWDGRLATGTRAYPGTYVARVAATSTLGPVELVTQFSYRRS